MYKTINEFISHLSSNYAPLYHGIKMEYALEALNKGVLDAYTFQRYWPDGLRRKDDNVDYLKS